MFAMVLIRSKYIALTFLNEKAKERPISQQASIAATLEKELQRGKN